MTATKGTKAKCIIRAAALRVDVEPEKRNAATSSRQTSDEQMLDMAIEVVERAR